MEEEKAYFQVSSTVYVRELAGIWMSRHWWILVLIPAAFAVAGLYDSRWLIVALMVLMILTPGIMMIVYFNFALSPEIARRTLRQTFAAGPEGFTVSFLPHEESGYSPEPEHIAFADIRGIDDTGKYFIVRLRRSPYSIMIFPTSLTEARKLYESWHNFC